MYMAWVSHVYHMHSEWVSHVQYDEYFVMQINSANYLHMGFTCTLHGITWMFCIASSFFIFLLVLFDHMDITCTTSEWGIFGVRHQGLSKDLIKAVQVVQLYTWVSHLYCMGVTCTLNGCHMYNTWSI